MNDPLRCELERSNIILEQPLGSGSFAEVWGVKHRGLPRALRICVHPLDDSPSGRLVQQEQATLRQLVSITEILNCIGFIEEFPLRLTVGEHAYTHYYATIWQLATANLFTWWRGETNPEKRKKLLDYLKQVARTIDLLNDHGFHHRDVKPENILLDGDTARLCDLGLAKQVGLSTYCGTFVGTDNYWPPEMQQRGESHATNDLYCLAASYLRLVTGLTPGRYLDAVDRGNSPSSLNLREAAHLAQALDPEPNRRPHDGAVAWVRQLDEAVAQTIANEEDPNLIPTRCAPPQEKKWENQDWRRYGELVYAQVTPEREALQKRIEETRPAYHLDTLAYTLNLPWEEMPSLCLSRSERCRQVVDWCETHGALSDLQLALEGLADRQRLL